MSDLYDEPDLIYENNWPEGRTPPKSQDNTADDQQQTFSVSVCPGKNPLKAAAVFVGLLCLVLLAAVIVLLVLLIQNKNNWKVERNRLWVDNAKLASERDELQTSNSEMKRLNHNLTLKTYQLESDIDLLNATNNILTSDRDELEKQIEKTRCPANWTKFDNSCYLISTGRKNWTESRQTCEGYNAQLVIISSIMEQTFIGSLDLRGSAWIGLSDIESENHWKWVDGTEATTTYWRSGQPDNYDQNEDCALIQKYYPALENWNDAICSDLLYFICEKILQ